jgi:hypothetical protein
MGDALGGLVFLALLFAAGIYLSGSSILVWSSIAVEATTQAPGEIVCSYFYGTGFVDVSRSYDPQGRFVGSVNGCPRWRAVGARQ